MDTRTKILIPEEAAARYPEYAVVLASFDVLTAPRIRSLRELADHSPALIAIVTEIPNSLLSLNARAELAASLAIIDCVVMAGDTSSLLANAVAIHDQRQADSLRTAELMEHVQRQNAS